MSIIIEKIIYEDDGVYGAVDEVTLYKEYNSVNDMSTIYDQYGNILLTCTDSYKKDGITQLIKLLTEDSESCDEITYVSRTQFEKEIKERNRR